MKSGEHYEEAERLLDSVMSDPEPDPVSDALNIAAAQVHATLALAAATANNVAAIARNLGRSVS